MSSNCFAGDKATYPPDRQGVFLGLDSKSSPTQIQNFRAQDLSNVQFTTTYGLKKRYGYSLVNNILDVQDEDFTAVTGGYYNKFSSGTERIFVTHGKNLYYDNSTVWSKVTPCPLFTAGQNNQFVFTTALDYVIGTNDVNPVFKVTDTPSATNLDLTDLGTDAPTKVKCLAWFQNHLILANTVENSVEKPTRIRWSDIGTIETWTEENRNDIAELGGQEINGLIELYNDLYILLTNSIWKMSFVGGEEQFKFTKELDNIGCIAKNSIQNVILNNSQRGIIFLSRNAKVYFFNGTTVTEISEIIDTTMQEVSSSRLAYAVSEATGEEYRIYLTLSGNSTNDTVKVFNYRLAEWTQFSGINSNAVWEVWSSDLRLSYSGDYYGCIFKLDDTSLDSDVKGITGIVTDVSNYTTSTASGLQVIYDSSLSLTTGELVGATITLTGGTGSSASDVTREVVYNTTSGIIVDSVFSTTPATDTSFSTGAIDSYYQTKDYDLGDSSRLKSLQKLYFWAKEQGSVSVDLSYKVDFLGTVENKSVSQDGSGGKWGTAVWGVSVWGGSEALLERIDLKKECIYMNFKISENDIDERFDLYGWNIIYLMRDIR